MSGIRASVVVGLALLMANGAGASGCDAPQQQRGGGETRTAESPTTAGTPGKNASEQPLETPTPLAGEGSEGKVQKEMKVLAEGRNGKVEERFIAVVRDAETYASLRELMDALPELRAESFRTHAVVAAFLGMRPTGGYSVSMTRGADGSLRVAASGPPKGAMLTQALTAPFRIVSVPLDEQGALHVEIGDSWNTPTGALRVGEGELASGGGFAGRTETFRLQGELRVMRLGKLATLAFDLRSAGGEKARALRTWATGTASADGGFVLPRLDAGTLVDWPNGGLRATGQLKGDARQLSLRFEPLPSAYSDGYSGAGKLEASASTSSPSAPQP